MILLAALALLTATPANLAAQVKAAQPGDTLALVGAFGRVQISGKSGLTIDGSQATITGLLLQNDQDITVNAGAYRGVDYVGGVYATGSTGIAVSGISVDGGVGFPGVTFRKSADVSLHDSRIANVMVGVVVLDDSNVEISGNEIVGVAADGATLVSSDHVAFTYNMCSGNVNDGVHHPDCAQAWVAKNDAHPATDLVISNNVATGSTQGFDDFGGDVTGYDRVTVENNTVLGDYTQGVAFQKATNLTVRGNRVATVPRAKWRTSINLTTPGLVLRCGNTVAAGAGKPAEADAPCAP